jgi:hypothetical protein
LDANNLNGWSMSQKLPVTDFRFSTDNEISNIDFCTVTDDAETGYLIECGLEYPQELGLHDKHNDYPLAPETLLITEEMLFTFLQVVQYETSRLQKRIPNLRNKPKYVTHYLNLKFYVSLGWRVTKISSRFEFSLGSFDETIHRV